jgi:hypothetical protein
MSVSRIFSGASDVPSAPDLCAIVIPLIGQTALANCLDRLPLSAIECIVVLREAMGDPCDWQQRYPSVNFLHASHEPVPLRRQRGVAVASSDVVAFLEDTSWPDPDWCTAVQSTFVDFDIVAAGGPVRIAATLPSRCQALGWSEYGAFSPHHLSPPMPGSNADDPIITSRVPGNNMAFRRAELVEVLRGEPNGLVEGSICARMLKAGRQVVMQPRMLVTYSACNRRNAELGARVHHGRIYAGMQFEDQSQLSRILHAAKAALLPIVLSARTIREMTGAGPAKARLPVLFWVTLMQSAWAMGEAFGALAGPGKSLNEWR